jgi:hypothetical protein
MLIDDLRRLRRLLGPNTALIVGGQACPAYAAVLRETGAIQVEDLAGLRREIHALRSSSAETGPDGRAH